MRIMVSNDDGVNSQGIQTLAEIAREFGEVIVVAPDRQKSGAGHSLTLHLPLRIAAVSPSVYAVDGTPTDCVMLGYLELYKKIRPDLLVSGINHGPNIGDDVTYSGTVAAAIEGTILDIPSVAFSLTSHFGERENFKPAANFARRMMKWVLHNKLPKGTLLNVNIPNVADDIEEIDAYEWTRLGSRRFDQSVAENKDPRGQRYFWIAGDLLDFEKTNGTDSNAIREGKISVTPLKIDMTHQTWLEELKGCRIL